MYLNKSLHLLSDFPSKILNRVRIWKHFTQYYIYIYTFHSVCRMIHTKNYWLINYWILSVMEVKYICTTIPGIQCKSANCKLENGVLFVTISLTDRVTTECFRTDLNMKSNTFSCTVWREAAFRNTTSNPFIKICSHNIHASSSYAYRFSQLYC